MPTEDKPYSCKYVQSSHKLSEVEKLHRDLFLSHLGRAIVVVGGEAKSDEALAKMTIGEMLENLLPNGLRFEVSVLPDKIQLVPSWVSS